MFRKCVTVFIDVTVKSRRQTTITNRPKAQAFQILANKQHIVHPKICLAKLLTRRVLILQQNCNS